MWLYILLQRMIRAGGGNAGCAIFASMSQIRYLRDEASGNGLSQACRAMTEFRIRRPRKLLNWFRRFWRKLVSAAVVAIGVLAFAFVLARVAAPFIISTGLVRNGIERAISQWTGHQAVIDGAPQVVFWPNPRITLADVTIEDPTADPPRRVAHIDSMSASFNLVKALVGNLKFNNFRFQRPHLYLRRDEKGALAWAGRGLFGAALSAVRPGPDGTQTLDATFNPSIGALTVEDGTLDIDDAFGGRVTLGGISADIDWPRLGDPAKAYVLARLGNQDVKLDLASSQPLMLLAGQNGNLMVKLQSQTLSGRFEGVANLAQEAYLAGAVELSTPDIPGLLAWRGAQLPAATHLKAASLTCNILASGGGVRLNNLSFTIDQTSATGALEFNVNAGKAPKLTGTLAFNQMDIRSALSALSITLPNGARPHPAPEGNGLIEQVDIDLRLSAQTASFGPLEARHIGASILSGGGKTSFDIGDSEFEGGQLIAHFGTTRGIGGGGDLDVTIRDADLAAAAEKLAISGPLPLGTGSLDVDLSTSRPLWETTATDVSGSAKLYVTSGTIPRLDAAAFRTLAGTKPFFRISDASGGDLDFDTAEIKAEFAKGSAEIRNARIGGRHGILTLTGMVPYGTSGMALAGTWKPPATDTSQAALQFFAGGSWPDPVISPVSTFRNGEP